MRRVGIGLQFGRAEMEKWFQRAMKADSANLEACKVMMTYLEPKWYGSVQELVAFGRACRATNNWRAGITLLAADAHFRSTRGMTPEQTGKYYYSPEVIGDIWAVYTEYLRHFPKDHMARTRFAVYCYNSARIDEANRQFLLLGDNLSWDDEFTEKGVKGTRAL